MIEIRPVSDLRNNFAEIEAVVREGDPVFLTKNGYGTMVVMSIREYSRLTDPTEQMLDETDRIAASDPRRLTEQDVFESVRGKLKEHRKNAAAIS